ncbi:MAG: DUF4430 domain-containing protein [Candidatus Kerfeldbacteria bacterium]|nr:DUF4430 domain-containing protein [Candidatus Kerfeldbacteria bacterium]
MKKFWKLGLFVLTLSLFAGVSHPTHAATYAGVTVRIETPTETVANTTVYVSSDGCTVTDSTGTDHTVTGVTAVCALNLAAAQIGFTYELVDSSYGLYLNSISEYMGDYSTFWLYYVNYESAMLGIADQPVADGDELLFTYGDGSTAPLRLTLNRNHRSTGRPVAAFVDSYIYDYTSSTGSYIPTVGATVYFGDTAVTTDAFGQAFFTPSDAGTFTVYATSGEATKTTAEVLYVYTQAETRKRLSHAQRFHATEQGVQYLRGAVNEDGLINDIGTTEWSAMALAAAHQQDDRVVAAVKAYHPTVADGAGELTRHILALEAIGSDARNADGVDYVQRLKNTKTNNQFGTEGYCNDDIFAALALFAADEPLNSTDVHDAVAYSLNCVNDDGGVSFAVGGDADIDMSAAWLSMAARFMGERKTAKLGIDLKPYRKQVVQFLRHTQQPDGGWGYTVDSRSNASTTAWVIMALRARKHEPRAMTTNNHDGFTFLGTVQRHIAGAFRYDTAGSQSIEALNTAYAIMALEERPFPVNKPAKYRHARAAHKK